MTVRAAWEGLGGGLAESIEALLAAFAAIGVQTQQAEEPVEHIPMSAPDFGGCSTCAATWDTVHGLQLQAAKIQSEENTILILSGQRGSDGQLVNNATLSPIWEQSSEHWSL